MNMQTTIETSAPAIGTACDRPGGGLAYIVAIRPDDGPATFTICAPGAAPMSRNRWTYTLASESHVSDVSEHIAAPMIARARNVPPISEAEAAALWEPAKASRRKPAPTVEIEAPVIAPQEPQESEIEPAPSMDGGEPVEALKSPEIGSEPVDISANNSGSVAEPVTQPDLDAQGDAMAAFIETLDTLPAVSAGTPTVEMVGPTARAKRTPAHERAIRRAWAERRERHLTRAALDAANAQYRKVDSEREMAFERMRNMEVALAAANSVAQQGRQAREHLDIMHENYTALGRHLDAINSKRRRSVLLAREMQGRARRDKRDAAALIDTVATLAAKRRRAVLKARQRGRDMVLIAKVARERIDQEQAALAQARMTPTYFDGDGMQRVDVAAVAFDQGRHALDKADGLSRELDMARAALARQQAAIDTLSAEYEAMALRAIKAERALAAVEARANGHPPAVRSVGVNFALAG